MPYWSVAVLAARVGGKGAAPPAATGTLAEEVAGVVVDAGWERRLTWFRPG